MPTRDLGIFVTKVNVWQRRYLSYLLLNYIIAADKIQTENMKKSIIIGVSTGILIISIILPYFLSSSIQTYIANVSTIITLCATLITMVIAMILFNQLGLDQTILQKKAEVVFRLLDFLNEQSFHIKTSEGYTILIWLTSISKRKESYAQYGHIKILYNTEYLTFIQPILDLQNDVFLPTEILPKISALESQVFSSMKDKVGEPEYSQLSVGGKKSYSDFTDIEFPDIDKDDWGAIQLRGSGVRQMTVKEFIQEWDDLIVTSTQWLNKYSSYQDLNIPFFRVDR